jgi:ribosomal protein L23
MINEIENDLQNVISILKYPVISDKTTRLLETNKYTFMVDRRF